MLLQPPHLALDPDFAPLSFLERRVVEVFTVRALRVLLTEAPVAIDREDDAAARIPRGSVGCDCAMNLRRNSGSGDHCASCSKKVASIHGTPSRGAR